MFGAGRTVTFQLKPGWLCNTRVTFDIQIKRALIIYFLLFYCPSFPRTFHFIINFPLAMYMYILLAQLWFFWAMLTAHTESLQLTWYANYACIQCMFQKLGHSSALVHVKHWGINSTNEWLINIQEPIQQYRKGTSIRQAPVFRHLRALRKSPWKFIIWTNELLLHCLLLVSYIQQYFNTSITVLTNQVWKLLIALFKVPNTGAFTVVVTERLYSASIRHLEQYNQ